jgi:hypothetical protein
MNMSCTNVSLPGPSVYDEIESLKDQVKALTIKVEKGGFPCPISTPEYPAEVQIVIDHLNLYKMNESLTEGNIFHLYPKGIAYPNGYYDSRFFDLHIFNSTTMEKKVIESRDGLSFSSTKGYDISCLKIFADGSTLIKFKSNHSIDVFQCVEIK